MDKNFILSIIIPTKNRESYIIKAVEQILLINDTRIQIVIQDNGDTPILSEMLSTFKNDVRIKYNYTKGFISFVDNFSLAVELSDGEYICIIGDDDGVVPQIVNVVEWAKRNNIEAIKPELNAVYFWPNSESINDKIDNGNLIINKITCKAKIANPYKEIIKLLNNGCQNYLSLDIVKLYHGIVRKESLNKIKEQTGRYFGGLSPDIYIAVSLSLVIDRLIVIDFPLTISGICNKSGSADSATGKHTGRLEDAPHFRGHANYNWSKLVPEFYSVETIWADSALAAIQDLNKTDLYREFNITALTSYCKRRYPQYKDIIMNHYNKIIVNYNRYKLRIDYIAFFMNHFMKRAIRKVKQRKGDIVNINSVENIIISGNILQQKLIDEGINSEAVMKSLDSTLS